MTDHALVPIVDNVVAFEPGRPTRSSLVAGHAGAALRRPRTWWFAIALASSAAGLVALGAPVIATGLVGLGFAQLAGSVVLQTRAALADARQRWPYDTPLEPEVPLHEVATPELRDTYGDVLRVYEEIRYALVEAEHLQPSMREVFDRCHATALAAGRLARLGNPLRRYLQDHDPARTQGELERLTSKATHAADREAARAYAHAAAARARQLDTVAAIERLRDRLRARLELARASLEAVLALVIELRAREVERVELGGDPVTEQLSSLREELEVLESSIAEADVEAAA